MDNDEKQSELLTDDQTEGGSRTLWGERCPDIAHRCLTGTTSAQALYTTHS